MTRLTNRGVTIGYISERIVSDCKVVLDRNQRTVGYIKLDGSGTYDSSWHRVADFSDAGLLLDD